MTVVASVRIEGHIYPDVEVYPVRSSYDWGVWETIVYVGGVVVNGQRWRVQRNDARKPYEGVYLIGEVVREAPLYQRSLRQCVCCAESVSDAEGK